MTIKSPEVFESCPTCLNSLNTHDIWTWTQPLKNLRLRQCIFCHREDLNIEDTGRPKEHKQRPKTDGVL